MKKKLSCNDKIVLTKGYRDRVTENDYWSIPLSILDKNHTIKEIYTNKNNVTWIYFGEKDINGTRIYVEEKDVRKTNG